MKKFKKIRPKRRRQNNRRWLILAIVVLVVVGGVWGLRHWYFNNLRPLSSSTKLVYFSVSSGESRNQIGAGLQQTNLIRSSGAFDTYVKSNEGTILEAGTYQLSPSMSVQQIVHMMAIGEVAKNLLTILPGKRIDQIEQAFAAAGYSQADISTAFNPATYAGNPALASLPAGASLEGYLYPDSFQKEADTPASTIISESLAEMQSHLTDDIIDGFGAQGLSVFQGITLASVVEQEGDGTGQEPTIAQVFISRLKQGMDLQSNVTADYAAAIAGLPPSINIESPYNTYLQPGLPPGPISNVTSESLNAVAHPSNTNYLYFVAGDDGTVYFSQTEAGHEQQIQEYCHAACTPSM